MTRNQAETPVLGKGLSDTGGRRTFKGRFPPVMQNRISILFPLPIASYSPHSTQY